jgi:hypothetical protein
MTIQPPPNFKDEFPSRGPWTSAAEPPEPFRYVSVLLDDGTEDIGYRTRTGTWRRYHELTGVIGWREIPAIGMTIGPKSAAPFGSVNSAAP